MRRVVSSSGRASTNRLPEPTGQRRTLVNVFIRPPFRTMIPSTGHNGEKVDRDRFIIEYQGLVDALKDSVVADEVNILDPLTGFEPIRTGDLIFGLPDTMFPMPPFGIEHRLPEMAELVRQIRAAGAWGSVQEMFQADDAIRVAAGDLVSLPGIVLAAESVRTNKKAVDTLQSAHVYKADHKAFLSNRVYFPEPNAPLLCDVLNFGGGQNIIVASDCQYGNRAMQVLAKDNGTRPWYFARVEPGVQWLAFNGGGRPNYDVICTDESEVSLQSLAKAGLNPIPIRWEEPRKLGLTLRSVCLGLVFVKSGGGNVAKSRVFEKSHQRVYAKEKRTGGDSGSPFWAQMRNYELPPIVFQEVPRYKAPMHGDRGAVTKYGEGGEQSIRAWRSAPPGEPER
jgi:hypothetical protein